MRQLPGNFGPLKGANANARVTGPCGDTMEFWLAIQEGRILRATFTTDGCGASIISGAVAASLVEGKAVEEALQLTPEQVEAVVGKLPEDHKHCPVLAVNTLRAALDQHRPKSPEPQPANPKTAINAASSTSVPARHGRLVAQCGAALRSDILANHERLQERNAVHRRFGYDPDASVRFVLGKALPLSGRVLDVGTGKGRFVIQLARHVARVTTVDINPEEQRCARLEAAYAGVVERIEFVLADARSMPWPAASFDAVTSWNVFHHLDDQERVFGEMLRLLKPGGKLVLADFTPSGFRLMDEIHAAEGRRHPHPPSRFAHWQARLRHAGFVTQRFESQHQEVLVAQHQSSRS